MKKRKKSNQAIMDIVKASRKINRQEEISQHGKTIHHANVVESKKIYKRKNKHKKKEDE